MRQRQVSSSLSHDQGSSQSPSHARRYAETSDVHFVSIPPGTAPGEWFRVLLPGYEPPRWLDMQMQEGYSEEARLEVTVPKLGPSVYATRARRALPARVFRTCLTPTFAVAFIWSLVLANWAVVVCNYACRSFRPDVEGSPGQLSLGIVLLGHAILLLQIVSFWQLQATHPGAPPLVFGGGPGCSRVCARSGLQQPERAMWVSSAGEMVLGVDHYCFWVGSPVGLRNRKYFILFLGYSALLCLYGAFALGHEVFNGLSARGNAFLDGLEKRGMPSLLAAAADDDERSALRIAQFFATMSLHAPESHQLGSALVPSFSGPFLVSLVLAASTAERLHAAAAVTCFLLDVPVGCLLFMFWSWHSLLALRNRTTLDTKSSRYDVGPRRNLEQVFGRRLLLWPIPIRGDGPSVDGLHWPLNPACKDEDVAP
ncbi:hypothetical protein EMIHUDRAFT_440235 [Emiliania huxleyi CCMP1516]|uniref:Palmitoyltransferase n=4 Tax=Emiliania huxleyi TaxID=2903 RepID=A0A0D3KQD3_EMIH1|nr:hypothetical protein EMIHUDRAFT_445237 [Emiliania huxleyi CCMP1516]XP_005790397.1 hypothetical protein EMIHUDRAFT_440235 [Emiliania huxleyi CCMP1516]EOD17247.1 hypothetical protein EMIHUDRAFT_445237 [Emiliania huxleyi CCMP1516]EOD37968.1 hypothetical protein EMIHUDRAFT_440235 [Emiliania huxleyi CCMP1516]|eukprot:XP_005769676.1 hypothetical protein EMIHUDRAFT_445237 [Emiliania huxleyi CCMP1516]